MGPFNSSEGWIEKKLKLIHLVAPLISYPKIGTINKSKIKKIHIKFKIFLKLFLGINVKKIKIIIDINIKIICFSISKIGYSLPMREYMARMPIKDKIIGIIKSFFDKIYQLEPSKLWSSLNNMFFKKILFL